MEPDTFPISRFQDMKDACAFAGIPYDTTKFHPDLHQVHGKVEVHKNVLFDMWILIGVDPTLPKCDYGE